MKKIITISRQCGSAGHTIGKLAAERLGIPFYDKQLIKIVSQRSGLSEETIEREGEFAGTNSFLFNIAVRGFSPFNAASKDNMTLQDQINAHQTELIRELTDNGPCVIVGRSADHILRDREDCLNVFIHGKLEDRVERIIQEHGIPAKDAKSHVQERDKKRSRYYKHVTDQVWGLAENYDLCLDSSCFSIEQCVEIILNAVK